MLGGCATPLTSQRLLSQPPDALQAPVELEAVPFFPQERYQCGPAALASVLAWDGVDVTPEQLTPQVYLPQRQGSLQLELVAAVRRHQRVPYPLQGGMEALLREVGAGHPVLVLQNLGLDWYPSWHYAVVVGYDLGADRLVLRSGIERRHEVSLSTFERTWRRGNEWALVVLGPEHLPATAEELAYLKAVNGLERVGEQLAAAQAYRSALGRWPQSLAAWFGLGNSLYAGGDLAGAEQAYRRLLELEPGHAPTLNNLGYLLYLRGDRGAAEALVRRALALEPRPAYRETLELIRR